ncbi:PH-like domain-containing protein [Motilibacter deserti]|uniref:PH-like domain-containing protein n=1 Tax=Motilibacter deserti TaxID=2714956 RepID=UPI001E2958C0|nr:hypothetical protein [Motilibacter deserti]
MNAALLLTAEQQHLTRLGDRLWLAGGLLAVLALGYLLIWRGWRNRGRRQNDVPALHEVPEAVARGAVRARGEGTYVVTTTAGDWLDRIVAHGLGTRSLAHMIVSEAGVLFARVGAPDVFVPLAALRGARLERGMAGKFVEEGGLVVVTWEHGTRQLDTGFRPRAAADRDELLAAVQGLVEVKS